MRKEKIKQKFTFYIISNAILSGQHSVSEGNKALTYPHTLEAQFNQ